MRGGRYVAAVLAVSTAGAPAMQWHTRERLSGQTRVVVESLTVITLSATGCT